MHSKILITILALQASLPFARAAALEAPLTDAQVRELVQETVDKDARAPGIVAGIIDETGSRVIACGTLKKGGSEKVDGDTLFEIGSITKVFTTLLLQEMVDHGEVSLDDPIGKFLPATVKTPSRNGREITLYHLATHTSGLPRLPFGMGYALLHVNDPYVDFKVKDFYKFLSHHKLTRDIGSQFEYSNAGMALLGHLLELKAGTNYESLVTQRICRPLGMYSTCIHLSPELKKRLASGHDEDGAPVKGWSPSDFPADGELRSSVNDLLKFLAANLALTPSPLTNAMHETQVPREKTDEATEQVGLGWMIKKRSGVIWHNGGTQGYMSYIAFNPARHRGIVVLASSNNDVDDLGEMLIGVRKWRKVAPIDPEVYRRYTGKYQFDAKRLMTISRSGTQLFLRVTGQDKIELFPESETQFFCKDLNGQAAFVTNETGQATELIWYQDGGKGSRLKRVK